ncbi:histidine phosphatase family protein [Paeniroseomonas aquatica]|uniref:histidine phosphatase family protein n=1 Tax=Paeniroseomonas aquatica TaxID=373043 RepID=UPI00361465E8
MILLRHGQSEFNLHFSATKKDPGIPDPKLTELGQQQAEAAALALASERIDRIIASPYTRALQTAAPIARQRNLPITVTPTVRERYAFSCDIGSPAPRSASPSRRSSSPTSTRSGGPRWRSPTTRSRPAPGCSGPRWRRCRNGATPSWSPTGASSWR